jgi:mono/diheme cytochrome c family protein
VPLRLEAAVAQMPRVNVCQLCHKGAFVPRTLISRAPKCREQVDGWRARGPSFRRASKLLMDVGQALCLNANTGAPVANPTAHKIEQRELNELVSMRIGTSAEAARECVEKISKSAVLHVAITNTRRLDMAVRARNTSIMRAAWVGCGLLVVSATACGARPDTSLDSDPTSGVGGSGGASTGTGTNGGRGGALPPLPGTGGSAGIRDGGFGGTGKVGPPVDAGTYSEAVVESEDSPPALAGGTLAIIGGGRRAAASDPDRDQVVTVDLDAMSIVSTAELARGDEPGRLVEDGDGRVHVALRGGRAVAVIDPTGGTVLARLPVCRHPRGLAYDAAHKAIHVACAGGELVSYAASTGATVRKLRLERDLRDVVVDGDRLLVSRFRAAELLVVESNGTVSGKLRPPAPAPVSPAPGIPPLSALSAVAWRTVASPDGGALMVYQLLKAGSVPTTPGGYGSGSCGGIISTSVTHLRVDGAGFTSDNVAAILPVDLATTSSRAFAVASGAWAPNRVNFGLQPYAYVTPPAPTNPPWRPSPFCGPIPPKAPLPGPDGGIAITDGGAAPPLVSAPPGRMVALAFRSDSELILQTREPAAIVFGTRVLTLPGRSRKHTGYELFHLATVGGVACASCHPEGHEDGQVWTFAGFGPRRTQSINGGISGTEPFHWSGDMNTFSKLAHDVFNSRMSGPTASDEHVASLFRWIDKIPRLEAPPADDLAAVERGRVLFNDGEVACATCHSGDKFTNNATVSVGPDGPFQVPSLVGLAWRAPYMHQGCAATLADRFGTCGGGDAHGKTSQLSAEQRADLIAYLETL